MPDLRPARRPSLYALLATLRYDVLAVFGLAVLAILAMFALAPSVFATHDPYQQAVLYRLLPPLSPSVQPDNPTMHILGTDELGRDLYSRIVYGARVSLSVGLSGVLFSGIVGVLLGLWAGYARGRVDDVISRLIDLQMSIPALLIALYVLYVLGPGFFNVVVVLTVVVWPVYARVTRGIVFSLREAPFVEAARGIGCQRWRIMRRHILPNLWSPIAVLSTIELARLILMEASLSFLGLGLQPPDPSWGLMIAEGRMQIQRAWWVVTFPGLAILAAALSANLVAVWLGAVTDPNQRWRWTAAGRRTRSRPTLPSQNLASTR